MQNSRSAHRPGEISGTQDGPGTDTVLGTAMRGGLTVHRSIYILLILVAMSIVGCGKEGEGSGGRSVPVSPIGGPVPGPAPAPPLVTSPTDSIIGVWQIAETLKTANDVNCQPPASPLATYTLYVAQNGTTAIAEIGSDNVAPFEGVDSAGSVVTGTFSGTTLALSGTNPDGGGTTTTNTTATVAAGCNTLTGTQLFSHVDPGLTCSGTIQFSGTRLLGSGCAVVGVSAVADAEPNDTAATAQAITLPAHITGTVTEITDADDWYSFAISGSRAVTIVLNGPAQDIDLSLFDNAGTTLIASSIGFTSRDAIGTTLAAGTYRVRVHRFNVAGTADYELFIQ